MKSRTILLNLTILFSLMLAACGTGAATPEVMMAHATDTPEAMMTHATETPDAMMLQDTAMPGAQGGTMEMADWLGTTLADARAGQNFKISDFSGKVVLVETMAVWCTNCHAQQEQIQGLNGLLGSNADLVSVSLDIDPNENPDILMKYVTANSSFNWRYAIAPAELAREFGKTYGDQFLNPPSTPILIIDRHGIAHPLPFGLKNAADLMKTIQPYLDDHM